MAGEAAGSSDADKEASDGDGTGEGTGPAEREGLEERGQKTVLTRRGLMGDVPFS